MALFAHIPHPHIAARARTPADPAPAGGAVARFNNRIAVAVTKAVGTMWCAYAFTALALVSLPSCLATGDPVVIVGWIAQTFLQLVLLSVILLGSNLATAAADERDERTYLDAEAVLHTALAIQDHLAAQDKALTAALDHLDQHSEALSGLHTRLDHLAPRTPTTNSSARADIHEGGGTR